VGNEFNIYWAKGHTELWGASVVIQPNKK